MQPRWVCRRWCGQSAPWPPASGSSSAARRATRGARTPEASGGRASGSARRPPGPHAGSLWRACPRWSPAGDARGDDRRRGRTAQPQHALTGTRPGGDPPKYGRPLHLRQHWGVECQRVAARVLETPIQIDVVAPQQANDPPTHGRQAVRGRATSTSLGGSRSGTKRCEPSRCSSNTPSASRVWK